MISIKKTYKSARKLFKQNDAMIPWETIQSSECLYNRWRALNENIGCWAYGVPRQDVIYNEEDSNVKGNDVALKFVSLEAPVKILLHRNGGDDYTYFQDNFFLHVEMLSSTGFEPISGLYQPWERQVGRQKVYRVNRWYPVQC